MKDREFFFFTWYQFFKLLAFIWCITLHRKTFNPMGQCVILLIRIIDNQIYFWWVCDCSPGYVRGDSKFDLLGIKKISQMISNPMIIELICRQINCVNHGRLKTFLTKQINLCLLKIKCDMTVTKWCVVFCVDELLHCDACAKFTVDDM